MTHRRVPYGIIPVLAPGLPMRSGAPLGDMICLLQRRNRTFPEGNASGLSLQFDANARNDSAKPSEAIETGRIVTPGQNEITYAGDAEPQTTVFACIGILTMIMPANLVEHFFDD